MSAAGGKPLVGTIALVTGASRGVGRGIALGLGEAGATVYVTGRTVHSGEAALPGGVTETAAEVTKLGGVGIAAQCDQRDDAQVAELFVRVRREHGRLDLLVNNALGSPEMRELWGSPRFWERPISRWDDLTNVGLRSHYVATWHAVPMMIERRPGLILNIASHASGRRKQPGSKTLMPYSVGKAALQRMTEDMATELREFGIPVIALWPPASITEAVRAQPELFGDLSTWRDPIFTGRVVAALAAADDLMERTGQALVATEIAAGLGVEA